jgi:DNA-binding HxlR family transcriptional regulator
MPSSGECRVDSVLKTIGDRWSLGILHALSAGPRRTLELHRAFKGLSTKTLAARLKKLERDGIVIRVSYHESPPRVEYSLTEKGMKLLPVIDAVAAVWNVFGFADNSTTSCRACAEAQSIRTNRAADSTDHGQQSQQDRGIAPIAKKKNDVTLL